jgi:hydroxylamine reductase
MTGFGHNAVLGIADKIINAIDTGDIKQMYLIGGCDGAEANRTYFRDIATGLVSVCVCVCVCVCGYTHLE